MSKPYHLSLSHTTLISVALFAIATGLWLINSSSPFAYFQDPPPGQLLYVMSKLLGLVGITVITLQFSLALLSAFSFISLAFYPVLHRVLGTLSITLVITHIILFFLAASIRQGKTAWSLLLPNFSDFYHTYISVGLFAVVFLIVVAISGLIRRRQNENNPLTKLLHRCYWIVLTLVYLHAFAIGSDIQSVWGVAVFSSFGLGIAALFIGKVMTQRYESEGSVS